MSIFHFHQFFEKYIILYYQKDQLEVLYNSFELNFQNFDVLHDF